MAIQRLVLIHPSEFEIPTMKDIDPVTNMKALPEDSEKAQDAEVEKIIKEEKNMLLPTAKLSKWMNQKIFNFKRMMYIIVITGVSYLNTNPQAVSFCFIAKEISI